MELRYLRYFQEVGRLGSITKAAAELHISQPSLTVAMQTLEEKLAVPLFERRHRHISLTPEGRLFLRRVQDVLDRLDDSLSEMQDLRVKQAGVIRLGIPPMIGTFVFPVIFQRFRTLYPDMELKIVEWGTFSILRMLEQGKLDAGFVVLGDKVEGIETIPVVSSEVRVCLPPLHPHALLSTVPMAALSDQRFILLKEDTYNRRLILEECQKNGFLPEVVFSTRQIQTVINLVEQGVGVSFLLDAVADKQSAIISRPFASRLEIRVGIAWRKDKYLSKAMQTLIAFFRDGLH